MAGREMDWSIYQSSNGTVPCEHGHMAYMGSNMYMVWCVSGWMYHNNNNPYRVSISVVEGVLGQLVPQYFDGSMPRGWNLFQGRF